MESQHLWTELAEASEVPGTPELKGPPRGARHEDSLGLAGSQANFRFRKRPYLRGVIQRLI